VAAKKKARSEPFGRPTDYRKEYDEQARKLCLLGATDGELADFFGTSEVTLNAWKKAYPNFLKSMNSGKDIADAEVADRMYQRAMGYSHEAVKIFFPAGATKPVYAKYIEHYPPDTPAASLWLRNRQPKRWRDTQSLQNLDKDGNPANAEVVVYRWSDPTPTPPENKT
jgi:hypothetical protein